MKNEGLCGIVCDSLAVREKDPEGFVTSMLGSSHKAEICVIVGGAGVCRILGETVECREGDLFLFDKGIPHVFFAEDDKKPLRLLLVAFSPNELEEDRNTLGRVFKDGMPYSYSVLSSEAMSEICRLMGLIRKEIDGGTLDFERAARAYLSLLLITLGRYLDLADTMEWKRPKEWSLALSAMGEVMNRYWEPDLTLGVVAESLFISRSRLSRAFVRATGESFPDYLRSVRIRAACALLERSEMINEEIACGCGFRDLPTFYSVFKKSVGVTPRRYREMMNNDKETEREEDKTVTVAEISESLQKGRTKNVKSLVEQAIAEGLSAEVILNEGLIGGMTAVGDRFKRNEVYVPEVLVAARAMNVGIETLRPMLCSGSFAQKGRVCIGTVRGDLHSIGKNLVKMMMESRGLEVIDLGVDVAPERFIETAIKENCRIICCSALLTTTMPEMAEVVKAAEKAGIRDKVKIMVGGAPVTEAFCREIGADEYSEDAATAAETAVRLCANSSN